MPKAVYIHIPFCNRICPYCDFNKYVLKGQPVESYLTALDHEIIQAISLVEPQVIESVFVGGGTPTVLTPLQMKQFNKSIHRLPLHSQVEWTVEANPETITLELLEQMAADGVNRLSVGVQTFEPQLLKKLGRLHSRDHVYNTITWAKQMGIFNLSIDLMFGLPEQSIAMLEASIDEAMKLDITHISAYGLKVEEGTFFDTLHKKKKLPLPAEEEEAEMFQILMDRLRAEGYRQYEISNFAKPGYESVHNKTYWKNNHYFGFGAGAHGYVNRYRTINAHQVKDYIQRIEQNGHAIIEKHQVSELEEMEETMMLGLRMKEGVSKQGFQTRFNTELEEVYGETIKRLLEKGLLETNGYTYALTSGGVMLGNEVFSSFLFDIAPED
jgi:oxygen-independent coproporphyrinogen-3 oxidase